MKNTRRLDNWPRGNSLRDQTRRDHRATIRAVHAQRRPRVEFRGQTARNLVRDPRHKFGNAPLSRRNSRPTHSAFRMSQTGSERKCCRDTKRRELGSRRFVFAIADGSGRSILPFWSISRYRRPSGHHRREVSVTRVRDRFDNFFAIENAGKPHQNLRGASRTPPRAIRDTIAVLTEIRGGKRNMKRSWGWHGFT